MDVYLVPIGRGRFECYFEAADDEAPDEKAAASAGSPGLLARWRATFTEQIRDAEHSRHQPATEEPTTIMTRLQGWTMRWIAERVAEQRLLWHLRGATDATLHAPGEVEAVAAEKILRSAMKSDAERHLRLLAVHSVGLLLSIPVALVPGPNFIGYLFTFTVAGHFLSWRGARRALTSVRWTMVANAELSEVGRALSLGTDARRRALDEAGARLRLPRLRAFVERLASSPA
jgi:hypothetical protein